MKEKARVLIVEDDSQSVRTTRFDLADELGSEVHIAESVEAAISMLEKMRFDILIVDVRIPLRKGDVIAEFGGLELIEKWDNMGPRALNANTPFLFLTAQQRSVLNAQVMKNERCLGAVKKLTQFNTVDIVRDYLEKANK